MAKASADYWLGKSVGFLWVREQVAGVVKARPDLAEVLQPILDAAEHEYVTSLHKYLEEMHGGPEE